MSDHLRTVIRKTCSGQQHQIVPCGERRRWWATGGRRRSAEGGCRAVSLSYFEAIVVGALQGVTELFPVSSLGHSVILPAVIGGQWATDLDVSAPESPYLAFIVGLHVATAAALLVFFWRDWVRIIGGFVSSIRYRHIKTDGERLAWLIIVATIPIGLAGLYRAHFRTVLGRPIPAAAFLMANGVILLVGERLRRRTRQPVPAAGVPHPVDSVDDSEGPDADRRSDSRIAGLSMGRDPVRFLADPGSTAGDQPVRGGDGCRSDAKTFPSRCRAVLVSAGHAGDSGGGGAQKSRISPVRWALASVARSWSAVLPRLWRPICRCAS